MAVSKAELIDAYRLILGREPEADVNPVHLGNWSDWKELRASFLKSPEARNSLAEAFFEQFYVGSVETGRRSPWIRTVTNFGRPMYVCVKDLYISRDIFMNANYGDVVSQVIKQRITPDTIFLDLGANIGWYTLFAADFIARHRGSGFVYSVEANPNVVPYLSASVVEANLEPYVQIKPYAVSNRVTVVQMDARVGGNLGGFGVSGIEKGVPERNIVPALPLDEMFSDLNKLDLVKIDIEGSEYLALEGGLALFSRLTPAIVMELNVERLLGVSRKSAKDVLDLMRGIGYLPFDFRERNLGEEIPLTDGDVENLLEARNNLTDIIFLHESKITS